MSSDVFLVVVIFFVYFLVICFEISRLHAEKKIFPNRFAPTRAVKLSQLRVSSLIERKFFTRIDFSIKTLSSKCNETKPPYNLV